MPFLVISDTDELLAPLSEAEAATLTRLLRKIVEHFEQLEAEA